MEEPEPLFYKFESSSKHINADQLLYPILSVCYYISQLVPFPGPILILL